MTYVGYFQTDSIEIPAPTMDGVPKDEPTYIPRHKLTHIITDVPEGTTKQMVEKKLERKSSSAIKLDFCVASECPSDVQAEMEAGGEVYQISWSQL